MVFKKYNNAKKKKKYDKNAPTDVIERVRTPRGKELLGILEQRVGGSRMRVRCMDAKVRLCRIPGKLKRRLWVREGDVLIVEPWEFDGDAKGDVVYKYRPGQVAFLKRKGYLDKLNDFEEF
jgi:translation initiation factor 1A